MLQNNNDIIPLLTAIAPDDYASISIQLTFTSSNEDTPQCINIEIVDDDIYEGPVVEKFQVKLTAVTTATTLIHCVNDHTVFFIQDNDGMDMHVTVTRY